MNVIIANKKKDLLEQLDIDVIKSVEGEYEVEDLISMFTNFFFNKMIIDISAIKNFGNYENLKKLSEAIDVNKIIILLGESSLEKSKEFISNLINLKIYNFTSTFEDVMKLFNKPNTYQDVKDYHYDISAIPESNVSNIASETNDTELVDSNDVRIIGIQGLTSGVGATTFAVEMVKELNDNNYQCIGVEMNKQDFVFFSDTNLYSCTSKQEVLRRINEHKGCNVAIVDLNSFEDSTLCDEVIYLIEPSTIKLTKLIKGNKMLYEIIDRKKVVLNRCNLSKSDINDFEVETNIKVFDCVDNFNDRLKNQEVLSDFLIKLGFKDVSSKPKKK